MIDTNEVPWGNLFRWVVSTSLLYLVLGFSLAVILPLGTIQGPLELGVVFTSAVAAAVAVWSSDVSWPGD